MPFEVKDVVRGDHHTLVLRGELDVPQAAEVETMISSSCAQTASAE
jgi:hypothetical protein